MGGNCVRKYNITFKMQCDSIQKLRSQKRIILLYGSHTAYIKYFHYVLKQFQ